MKNIKPITPQEVKQSKESSIPDEVIDAFNKAIINAWDGKESSFAQDAVIDLVVENFNKSGGRNLDTSVITRAQIFDKSWLDVEGVFERNGWKVEYDKPNEMGSAVFTFRQRRGRQAN